MTPDKDLAARLAELADTFIEVNLMTPDQAHACRKMAWWLANTTCGQLLTRAEADAMVAAAWEAPDHVTKTHMLGMHAAELSVALCRLGLFPSVGVDDSGEFVLGPFRLSDSKIVHGCASVFWDDTTKKYCWSAYIDFEIVEVRGHWPIGMMPDELAAAIRAAQPAAAKGSE